MTKISQIKEEYIHRRMWRAASICKSYSERENLNILEMASASLLLAYCSLEGYVNWLGAFIDPEAWDNDQKSFGRSSGYPGLKGKISFLGEKLGVTFGRDAGGPMDTLLKLQNFRHRIVHAKRQVYEREVEYDGEAFSRIPDFDDGVLMNIDSEFVEAVFRDVQRIAGDLNKVAISRYPDHLPHASPFCDFLSVTETVIPIGLSGLDPQS